MTPTLIHTESVDKENARDGFTADRERVHENKIYVLANIGLCVYIHS